jgi:8-oxo-dGTP pyrophosphatase MutT (NUDIX family)
MDARRGDAGCLIVSNDKTLLVVHRFGGKLGFPGGGGHAEESAQCTAHRETWEETGLDVTVGPLAEEFREGFMLYACDPGPGVTSESAPALKSWSKLEISGLVWRDAARETTWRDWRFPSQRRAARELTREDAGAGGQ